MGWDEWNLLETTCGLVPSPSFSCVCVNVILCVLLYSCQPINVFIVSIKKLSGEEMQPPLIYCIILHILFVAVHILSSIMWESSIFKPYSFLFFSSFSTT